MKSGSTKAIAVTRIAPCGMNCSLCHAYLREKNVCPGCNEPDDRKPKYCVTCRIRNCEERKAGRFEFCFSCSRFPCARMKQLDKRYRTRYAMSMIENLECIKEHGIREFIRREKKKWICPGCGGNICVHKQVCIFCGYQWRTPK